MSESETRPCLRCDKPIPRSTEYRLCRDCNDFAVSASPSCFRYRYDDREGNKRTEKRVVLK